MNPLLLEGLTDALAAGYGGIVLAGPPVASLPNAEMKRGGMTCSSPNP